ncbi:MAG: hypothetical protein GY710_03800 [Desulfobacteraceae bacterium]|nr:hypothetical protein [Desulfobacteraceae bacterium]
MITNISDLLSAHWQIGVIVTAIRLRIFSIIADQKLELNEIAAKCEADSDRIEPLLDACISLGLLEFENKKYQNSHFSLVYFVEGKRFYVGDCLTLMNNESIQWFQLPDLIRGKERKKIELPGLKADSKTFITAMNSIGLLGEAEALKDMVDLAGCKTMTDAGGGSGLYSITLCQKYPHLTSTILDVKDTLEVTRELIENHKERNQIILKEGDFMKDPLGKNVDAVLLSDVIYGHSEAKILLQNAWDSLVVNGVLIVRGYYANPKKSGPLFGALFAVKQMVDDPQRKIMTLSMLKRNVKDVGFENVKATPLTEYSFILTCKKGN